MENKKRIIGFYQVEEEEENTAESLEEIGFKPTEEEE